MSNASLKEKEKQFEIGNQYGSLVIKELDNKYYWAIEDFDGVDWREISKSLYDELLKHRDK